MEMAQKLCLLEMTRKFISVIVQFRHQSQHANAMERTYRSNVTFLTF